jgi:hypothetical protein
MGIVVWLLVIRGLWGALAIAAVRARISAVLPRKKGREACACLAKASGPRCPSKALYLEIHNLHLVLKAAAPPGKFGLYPYWPQTLSAATSA